MFEKNNWTEKDEATIKAIIVNMINQKQMFRDLGEDGTLPNSFKVQNTKDYVLGIFTGIVVNLFANYWIGEHEVGLLPKDLEYLYYKISSSSNMIIEGIFG